MATVFMGIDLGQLHHEAAAVTETGDVRRTWRCDHTRAGLQGLGETVPSLAGDQPVVFGLEATGHYWLALYAAWTARAATVQVITPLQSASLRQRYLRVTKTDRQDAFLIAEMLRMGRYTTTTVPEEDRAALRDLSRLRGEFTQTLGTLKRQVHALIARIFPAWPRLWSDPFGARARAVLSQYPPPAALAAADLETLTALIGTTRRHRLDRAQAERLHQAARTTVGVPAGLDAAVLSIPLLWEQRVLLATQIAQIDARLAQLMQDPPLILTLPGIGPTLGAAILGDMGDIHRLASGKKLKASAGLDASVHHSGEVHGTRSHLSKRGSPYLRRALWWAAHLARRVDPAFRA
jgi:transposase